jgi:hypothetical protein
MNNRYIGELATDVYGLTLNEMRLGHIRYTAAQAVASDPDGLLDGHVLGAAVAVVVSFLNPMPYARNVTVVASAATTAKVTIRGKDLSGALISEELTLNGTTPVVGVTAFASVESVVMPIKTGSENVDLGWGELIGLPFKLSAAPLHWVLDDGAAASAAAFTANATVLSKNVVDFNGSLNGSVMDLFLVL